MPITYKVFGGGHNIHAVADPPVTPQEFVDYEINHAIDDRLKPPVSELFEIRPSALSSVTKDDITRILERRRELPKETISIRHRCGMVVSYGDYQGWDIAKFFEGMMVLHSPEVVIIFGDRASAGRWLGFPDDFDTLK